MKTIKKISSPVGLLWLESNGQAITAIRWSKSDVTGTPGTDTVIEEAEIALQKYFSKEDKNLNVPFEFDRGTPFQRKVWQALTKIPYGETLSYGAFAQKVGSSPRAVGGANGKNPIPIVVPCHRVIGANGKLTGYSGGDGLKTKQILLDLEKSA